MSEEITGPGQPPESSVMTRWRYAQCYCHGGLVGGYDGYPKDCPSCAGTGGVYVTENGARAVFPGGPFLGRDNHHEEWLRGVPVTGPEYNIHAVVDR